MNLVKQSQIKLLNSEIHEIVNINNISGLNNKKNCKNKKNLKNERLYVPHVQFSTITKNSDEE